MTDHLHKNHDNVGFEREDLGSRPVFGFIISLAIAGILIYYAIWGIFHFLDAFDRKNQQVVKYPTREAEVVNTRDVDEKLISRFPEPRLEQNERNELSGFRYGEEEELNSYGWVDEKNGIAHIPITQAMQLIAQRGLPTTPQAGTVPMSPVNLARAAAAASDTSGQAQPQAQQKGKKQ